MKTIKFEFICNESKLEKNKEKIEKFFLNGIESVEPGKLYLIVSGTVEISEVIFNCIKQNISERGISIENYAVRTFICKEAFELDDHEAIRNYVLHDALIRFVR